jgi:signal transduction histidine kinase
MSVPRGLLRSSTFRLALLYALVFALSVVALLAFLYWSTAGYMARQADATIEAEIEGLAEQYRREGLDRLNAVISERIRRDPAGKSVYLFAGRDYGALAGNISRWPETDGDAQGWLEFPLNLPTGSGHARARAFMLGQELRLLVGRDVQELRDVERLIVTALAWGLALTVALAVVGGMFISRGTLRRIEQINATGREIMAGDLTRRVPVSTRGDDFDQLAGNLNRMLDEIESLMGSVRQVSDNVAHDLRTPLTRLRHRLEDLRGQLEVAMPPDPGAQELTEKALEDTDHLLTAFTALLRIARLESGRAAAVSEPVDLHVLSADAFDLYEASAEDAGIQLRQRCAPDAIVIGDRDLLFQALGNLLDNALKFTPRGGEVLIEVASRDDALELSIVDGGPGIPAELHDKVFGRFFRADSSRTMPGHGLGLSLVAAVASHHGAGVSLYDNAPGLTVTLRFARER